MSKAVDILKFTTAMLPIARDIIRALFNRTGGDVEAAKVEGKQIIRRITDHGAQLDEFEVELDRRVDVLRAREAEVARREALVARAARESS